MAATPTGVVLDSKYRLDSMIAEGGMGSVYKATHVMLGKTVAIKLIKSAIVTSLSWPTAASARQCSRHRCQPSEHRLVYDPARPLTGRVHRDGVHRSEPEKAIQAGRGIPAPRTIKPLRQVASASRCSPRQHLPRSEAAEHHAAKGHDGEQAAVDFDRRLRRHGATMVGHALGSLPHVARADRGETG
jgi:serine/threonine protein kinase